MAGARARAQREETAPRAAASSALDSATALAAGSASQGSAGQANDTWRQACGYANLPVQTEGPSRSFLAQYNANYTTSWSTWLRSLSVGSCMEYHLNATVLTPSPCAPGAATILGATCFGTTLEQTFVATPDAWPTRDLLTKCINICR